MKIFAAAVLVLACAYGALLLFARLFAERIIFPAPPASYSDDGDIIYLGLPGGGKAASLWIPAKDSKVCAIYSHGNGEDLGEIRPLLEEYARRGISVFAYDYPGYGLSSGKPSIKGLEESSEAAYRHVSEELGFEDSDIAVVGYSLGSAAACEIASRHPGIRCAVIIGGFSKAVKAVLPMPSPPSYAIISPALMPLSRAGLPIPSADNTSHSPTTSTVVVFSTNPAAKPPRYISLSSA